MITRLFLADSHGDSNVDDGAFTAHCTCYVVCVFYWHYIALFGMFSYLLDSTGELAIMLINVLVFVVRPLEQCPFVPRSAFSRPHKVNVGLE